VLSLKKKFIPSANSDLKERLFFHDIINQTHGLLLFLGHKEMLGEGIDKEEVQMMEKEIKTLQSLIRDHYNYKHKNLIQTYDWVPFSYAKLAFNNLTHTYLENVQVYATFNMKGEDVSEDLIYYPSFYRIMNNLIKNIAESKCTKVDFSFTMGSDGLFIESKNKLHMTMAGNSSEHLARVILDEKTPLMKNLGLESIHHLVQELGGSFKFEILENNWVNHLYLPTEKPNRNIKTDKIPA
jgi:hypothetical protein